MRSRGSTTKNPAAMSTTAASHAGALRKGTGRTGPGRRAADFSQLSCMRNTAPPETQTRAHTRKSSSEVETAVVRNTRKPMSRSWRRCAFSRGRQSRTPHRANRVFTTVGSTPVRAARCTRNTARAAISSSLRKRYREPSRHSTTAAPARGTAMAATSAGL